MQPNPPPYGNPWAAGPSAFGPPPGQYGFAGYSPAGPPAAIVPAGSGGFALKYASLAGYLLTAATIAGMVVVGSAGQGGRDDRLMGLLAIGCFGTMLLWGGSGLAWIYKSWEFLPPGYRRNAAGREFSPGSAVGWQFVPLYNLYWIFVQNLGYCDAIDAAMIQSGRPARAPRTLATVACALQVVPYLNFLAAPIAWIAYMFAMDAVKSQLTPR